MARARFAIYGESTYPDATFTLRLSYGRVAGWSYRGQETGPFTTFGGLFDRATGAEPYALAPRWLAARERLDPDTIYDFVTTNDIIGGNSGSPVLDARGRLVGLAFDGNWESVSSNWVFDPKMTRMIAVDQRYMRWIMQEVFPAPRLLEEMGVAPKKR